MYNVEKVQVYTGVHTEKNLKESFIICFLKGHLQQESIKEKAILKSDESRVLHITRKH
jgi:hypothetical protein